MSAPFEIPPSWEWTTLGEIADVVGGVTKDSKRQSDPSFVEVPYLRVANVQRGYLDLSNVATIRVSEEKARSLRLLAGDVLLNEGGDRDKLGRGWIWEDQIPGCIHQNHVFRARVRGGVLHPKILAWHANEFGQHWFQRNGLQSVNLASISLSKIKNFPVPVPPLAEQCRIVSVLEDHLSVVDSGVAQLSALTGRVSRFRDQVMLAASTGQLSLRSDRVAGTRLDPAGVDDGKLPPLPKAWKWMRLREIADVVGGVTKDGKRQSDPSFVEVPYLRVANVQRAYLDLTDVAHIRVAPQKAQQLRLRQGDVLLNEGGDRDKLGRGWIWEDQVPDCIHQNHVFRARISEGVLHPKLLAWHANGFGRRWFEVNGLQSVNLASISLRKMKEFPVPVPPLAEQAHLVELAEKYLSLLDGMEKAIESARRKAVGLRTALLATAFAGRLVPQDPNDEPASELLARIRAERAAVPPKQRAARGRRTQKDKPAPPTRVIGRDYQQGELPL
ncbi:restriction endonuclease subunit S [Micromonospora sp. WMMD1102]|uniref:restriction endonuclease subunit S n=1 Tax=Micromonospora sp. WMMD1102 TaxID=3016105 RepID=UPI002414D056|nr:restriction endonuclease subunit S [Micromonospora sp. WMMD1102]MDG4791538.1 restriction endonuclease subunit S [Micromonospora sp. WMMD1102]